MAIANTPSLNASIRDLLNVTITFFRISSKMVAGEYKYATIATATFHGARLFDRPGADSETRSRIHRPHRRIRQQRQLERRADRGKGRKIQRRMEEAAR